MKKNLLLFAIIISNIVYCQNYKDFGKDISDKDYYYKDINFNIANNIKLYGTLITPKNGYNKVILIAPGSGPDSRKSHYVLVQELLNNNTAVFRYDERGIGQSEGNFKDNVEDLYYAFDKIKKIDSLSNKKFGIVGHSMGCLSTLNVLQKYKKVDFLILLSAPVVSNGRFRKRKFKDSNKNKISIEEILKNINIPTLFIEGTEDSFFDYKKTFELVNGLENVNIQIKILQNLNHFLKVGNDNWRKTLNYDTLYEIDKMASSEILNWLNKLKYN